MEQLTQQLLTMELSNLQLHHLRLLISTQTSDKTGTGGTLTNTGTIINATGGAGQSIRVGDGDGPWNNLKIINSGTISSIGESVLVSGGSGTTD